MKASSRLMLEILKLARDEGDDIELPAELTDFTIAAAWEDYSDGDLVCEIMNDVVREGQVETDIECDVSRHYESKSVARLCHDGTWIGWTYWYGGGKYGEPESVEWIDDAYYLDVAEEEKTVIVRTFKKIMA